jgi:O-antigen/teichoic acid export membrane protein
MLETVKAQETVTKQIHTAVRHGSVYGLGNVLAKAIGFLMIPFYTRYLNPTEYGVLEILDLSVTLFGMVLNMGITGALLRSYGAARSEDEKRQFVSTAFLFVGVTGLVTLLAGAGLIRPASRLLLGPNIPATYLLMSFTSFILAYIGNLPRTYLMALEFSGALTLIDTVGLLVMLGLNIYFIAVLKIGLLGILWSSLIVAGLQAALITGWTLRKVGIRYNALRMRQMVRFGLPLIFSNLAVFTLNFSDRFFLQHLRSLEVVGIYALGYKFGFMINYFLLLPFYTMWQSRMYIIHSEPEHPKIFGQIFVLYSMLLIYAGLGLAVMSPEIVHLMAGPKFTASLVVIPIVALSYVIGGIGYYLQTGMFLSGKTHLIGIISAAAAVLDLGLNYVLVMAYGMVGAACATLLSFTAIAAASYCFSQHVFALPLRMGRVAIMMLLATGLYTVSRLWSSDSLGLSLLMKGLLLVVFPAVVWETHILSAAEIETLVSTRDVTLAGVSKVFGLASKRAVNR